MRKVSPCHDVTLLYTYRKHASLRDAQASFASWADVKPQVTGQSQLSFYSGATKLSHQTQQGSSRQPRCIWKDHTVMLNTVDGVHGKQGDYRFLTVVAKLRSASHDNLLRFMGLVLDAPEKYIMSEMATRGTLADVLKGQDITLTKDFKLSLLSDVASGMRYIHEGALGVHGCLSSRACLIDSRWNCKVSDYWVCHLAKDTHQLPSDLDDEGAKTLRWTAPEVLRGERATWRSDVYSYGIITQEVTTEAVPFHHNVPTLSALEIVQAVREAKSEVHRPKIPKYLDMSEWAGLAERCWAESPEARPTFQKIMSMLRDLNEGRRINLVENMAARLEAHTRHLEDIVAERSQEVIQEKNRVENLLCELLPRSVFRQLQNGKRVEPETFDEVTLFFSDIVSFTRISSRGTPLQIVAMLNRIYSLFDDIIVRYDVYKVATIGDAYLVASGLPQRNGNRHAGEIAGMALALLKSIDKFAIRHIPGEYLQIRVGLHTGSCVAGVTGLKTPRYLLFGDTVNTGARIEALGESMRIHVSETTSSLLEDDHRFKLTVREPVDVPGYGIMITSWLSAA